MAEADDLGGMPVVVADLHSALPAVLIGMLATDPDLKVAYVMLDGGALPAPFSKTLDALHSLAGRDRDRGPGVRCHFEAVTVHTGLLAARHVLRADLAIVTQGPGEPRDGPLWGFSGSGRRLGVQRRDGARRRGDRRAADLRRRPAPAAPRACRTTR